MNFFLRRYQPGDETALLALLRTEGADWSDYHSEAGIEKFRSALNSSLVYLAFVDSVLCGYIRIRDDSGFGLYVYDLLVHRDYRDKGYGRALLEQAQSDFPASEVYVLSDVDSYYEKLGYHRLGSVFRVSN